MFRNIRRQIASLLSVATLVLVPVAVPALASAATTPDIQGSLCGGTQLKVDAGGTCSGNTKAGTDGINNIITTGINVFSVIVGVVSVVMIILGGFRYITSGGESSNVTGAKNTIVYAIIGLVVVALAQFIVKYVLNKVTSAGTTGN